MAAIIQSDNLSYYYEAPDTGVSGGETSVPVLDGIDLKVETGSFVAILGHNGSGKSTLAKHFNGILLPSGGKLYVDGMDTVDKDSIIEIRRRIGMVFQNHDNQIVANVVEDDVAFAPENLGVPSQEIRRRVDEALKTVDMYQCRLEAPHLLSGGQKQRVAIAGILAMHPKCVVLDEPTAMLDPRGREEVISTVHRLNREQGITVVLITHHMNEVIDAHRLIILSDGRIVEDGAPDRVFSNVERLWSLGLDVPETTQLMFALRKEGLNLPLEALSVEDCATAIHLLLQNKV